MGKYRILIKKSAAKEIEAIRRKEDRRKIVAKINSLANNPRPPGCKKLTGSGRYRLRQGPYRIIYSVEDDRLIINLVKVGDRKNVYRTS